MALVGSALAQPGTIIQTETRVVLVDAVVTDKKGNYVSGLTQKDFRVWEDNKEQRTSSFSAEASQGNSQKRYLILFFDETTMAPLDRSRAKTAAARLVDTFKGPDRMVALLNYSGSFEIVQNFTNDAERLKEAINGVRLSPAGAPSLAPEASLQLTYGAGAFASRGLLLALRALARNMMNLPGRKSLVLFTGGFPVSPLQRPELTAALDACNRANIAVYPMDLRGIDASPSSAATPPSEAMPSAAAARGHLKESGEPGSIDDSFSASSPPWRTGGPAASSRNNLTSRQIMDMLADGTGGFVSSVSNPVAGITRIAAEQDAYYLLGYTPAAGLDRNCHSIQVKTERAGFLVRARSGYCNAKPAALKAGGAAEQQLEARAAAPGAGFWAASMQAPFFYVSPGLARVNVALDVAAAPLQFEKRNGKMHAAINLLGLAYASDGSVAARFTDSLDLNPADSREVEKLKEKPLHYESQFEIAPGNYTLKLTFGSSGEAFGKLDRPLSIEPFEAGQFAISALALSKEVRRASAGSAEIEALLLQDKTPLIANDLQVVPSGSSDFHQGAPAMFYFEVYEPVLTNPGANGPALVAVQIRVIDRNTGEAKSDSGLMRLESPKNTDNAVIPVALKVPLERLAPGSYLLELTASDSANNTARRTADFQVK